MTAVPLAEQLAAVRREIGMRVRVYPRFVAAGKMKQDTADREIAAMRGVLITLETAGELYKHRDRIDIETGWLVALFHAVAPPAEP